MVLLLCKHIKLSKHLRLATPSLCHRFLHPQHLVLSIGNSSRPPFCSPFSSRLQSCPFLSRFASAVVRCLQTAAQLERVRHASSLDLKCDLLRREGFSPAQVKVLQDNPRFRAVPIEKVAAIISFLRAKGIVGAPAGRILSRTPIILSYRVERLERKCKFFEELGIGASGLGRLLTNTFIRSVAGLKIESLQKHIDFLQRIGLSKQDIRKVMIAFPNILHSNIERKMEPALAFFERHGMSKEDFCRLVRIRPQVFGCSIDGSLTEKVNLARRVGLSLDSNCGMRAIRSWITVKARTVLSKWEYLKLQGFSEAQVLKMVKLQPEILAKAEDSLRRKTDYLKNVLKRDLQELAKFPAYLNLSLENRIIPRFTYLNELKEKGNRANKYALSSLLAPSDEVFERRYAAGYGKWKAGYFYEKEAADV